MTGWPTKVIGMPAASKIGGSKGMRQRMRSTRARIFFTRPGRQAQSWGAT
jgi:hypothetical protein